ncbi:hypothetical protein DAEQUDRAFT_664994, partial [Daedalea quercina L-15889]
MRQQLKQLRAQLANAKRRLATAKRQIADYQRIMIMLANNDFASLRRLLSVSLRHGSSPAAILMQLQRALDGLYNPRSGFTQDELDVAFIAKALGGQRLLYALQKSHGLPSHRTVQRHCPIPRMVVSVGKPSQEEFDVNIEVFLNPEVKPGPETFMNAAGKPTMPGNILMFDGIALEGRCRYCPQRDQIMGFCREHGQNFSMKCDTVEDIEKLRDLVEAGKLCYGSDATVVAVAPYAQTDHYTPVPLVLSPSDKTEKGEQLMTWIHKLLGSWEEHKYGAKTHGPIWALASDGDSSFRLAKHLLCMTTKLNPESPLSHKLAGMPGLNTMTSSSGITGTCDPKHIFKRFGTLLRSPRGVGLFGDHITRGQVHDQLCQLGLTKPQVDQLLDPADKQNVPKAVKLLQHLLMLHDLPKADLPATARHQKSVAFLGKMMGYFLLPFISVSMSLSEQVQSLSTFAHLAAATYMQHRTACLTGALYHDTQAIVKNIIFTIARTQLIN